MRNSYRPGPDEVLWCGEADGAAGGAMGRADIVIASAKYIRFSTSEK